LNGKYNIWNKWDPLKTVMLGDCYSAEFFRDIKNDRIRSALSQIADETQEDLAYYEQVLKDFGCEVIRPKLDDSDSIMNYINDEGAVLGNQGVPRSPLQPRDHQMVAGSKGIITFDDHAAIADSLLKYNSNTIDKRNQPWPEFKYNQIMCPFSGDWPEYLDYANNYTSESFFKPHVWQEIQDISYNMYKPVSSAAAFPIGTRMYHSTDGLDEPKSQSIVHDLFYPEFDMHWHNYDGHADANFHPIKPGAILSLYNVQTYQETFPGWDVCYLPDQSWSKVSGFLKMKSKVSGKWWVPEQEDNDEFTYFVETWLNDWVGYAEETVFDVNVLVLDEKHVCVSQQNNEQVNNFLKKHGMEPVYIPWRHRYFWDGGLHCITLDLYREGTQQDYFKG
jgi:hypothetical protein